MHGAHGVMQVRQAHCCLVIGHVIAVTHFFDVLLAAEVSPAQPIEPVPTQEADSLELPGRGEVGPAVAAAGQVLDRAKRPADVIAARAVDVQSVRRVLNDRDERPEHF
jgi:hypothetical protein